MIYPLKSAAGNPVELARVEKRGLEHDRRLGLFDAKGVVVTARDYPLMLDIHCAVGENGVTLSAPGQPDLLLDTGTWTGELAKLDIWEDEAHGLSARTEVNHWFSDYLNTDCRLMLIDDRGRRDLTPAAGGQSGDQVSFADECPLLLAASPSLDDLNQRLETPVPMSRFRPNVVVEGSEAFAEDEWKRVRIGEVVFDVTQRCKRCVFTTIDADTKEKHPNQELLRTLSSYRRHPKGGAGFGVHLVRRGEGIIRIGDTVTLLS